MSSGKSDSTWQGHFGILSHLFYNVITSGSFDTLPVMERGRLMFLNMVQVVGSLTYLLFSIIAIRSGNVGLAVSSLVGLVLLIGVFVYLRTTRNTRVGAYLDASIILVLYAWLVWSGGEGGSGILWTMSFPLITLFLLGSLQGSLWALGMWAFMAGVIYIPGLNPAGYSPLFGVRILGSYFFIWLFALAYESVRASTQRQLEETNRRLAATTEELSSEKSQTDAILRNVKEGIFLLEKDGRIGAAHSAHSAIIFEAPELAGQPLMDILQPHLTETAAQAVGDWLPMLFDPAINPRLVMDINPLSEEKLTFFDADGMPREKIIRARFENLGGGVPRALCTVQDVSDEVRLQRQLQAEEGQHRKSMEKLFQIIHVEASLMTEFIAEAEVELETINNYLRDPSVSQEFVIPLMYQGVHGIKGNALLLGLKELGAVIHQVESEIKEYLDAPSSWSDLLKFTLGIGRIQQEVDELKSFIRKVLEYRSESGGENRRLLEQSLTRLAIRDAEAAGKSVVLDLDHFDSSLIPPDLRKPVKDCAIQLVRNAIHHGIEQSEQRVRRGKCECARLELALGLAKDRLVLTVKDDGQGLDMEAIRDRIRSEGRQPEAMSQQDQILSIFGTGFSTAGEASLEAGRGAGLALVKRLAESLGGGVALRFWPGQGTEFQVRFAIAAGESDHTGTPGIAPKAPVVVDSEA